MPCGGASVVTVKLLSAGRIGAGALKAAGGRIVADWNASPDGASMRRIHWLPPVPPARFDVKKRYLPSSDQRGLLASVPGDVRRTGSPDPFTFAIQISVCRRFSLLGI